MNPQDPNVQILQAVARALGELRNDLVFVGGCAAGLLITDESRPVVRATQDVDLIAEVATKGEYHQLCVKLRSLGFNEDVGPVICRWRLGDLQVDVMPTVEGVLNFTNMWYAESMKTAHSVVLPNGDAIWLIGAPHFIATKIEAFHDRGRGDFSSHDLEDIINVIDGRPSVVEDIRQQAGPLQSYLRDEFDALLSNALFLDTLPWHLRPPDQGRLPIILQRMREIAGL